MRVNAKVNVNIQPPWGKPYKRIQLTFDICGRINNFYFILPGREIEIEQERDYEYIVPTTTDGRK